MDGFFHAMTNWLQPLAETNIGDFVFFRLVNDYFSNEIAKFGLALAGRAMRWVSAIALTLTTLWVTLVGYRLATGQSRESAMAIVDKAARIAFVLTLATAVGIGGAPLHKIMTDNLDKEIHELFTGEQDTSSADAIDQNLAYTQVALAALDAVRITSSDPEIIDMKARSLLMAGVGTASPPMVAGAMLLLYKFTMAFLIGVGPIFILFLAFDQTKDLFKRWLFYIIGTLFSMSILSVVSGMVLKFTAKVAAAFWLVKFIPLASQEGLNSQALQQGGLGLLMTVVIVTVPAFGAAIWQANMGNFMHFSAFGGGAASSPGPQGQPAGSYVPPQPARSDLSSPYTSEAVGSPQNLGSRGVQSSVATQPTGTRGNAVNNDGNRLA